METIYIYRYVLTQSTYVQCRNIVAWLMSIVLNVQSTRVDSKLFLLPFGHRRDLVAFNGTGLQNKSF